jgi:GNAT superfamily N-acetyltransferase
LNFTFHWLTGLEIPLANKFYRMHGFRGKARRNESCGIVMDDQAKIIACAYLRRYTFADCSQVNQLLAGVAVARAYQGQGVARYLLQQLSCQFDRETYAFPFKELVAFYQSLGFQLVGADLANRGFLALYQSYIKQGRNIALMKFQPEEPG